MLFKVFGGSLGLFFGASDPQGGNGQLRPRSPAAPATVCSAAAGNIDTLVRNQGNVRARSSAMMGLAMY